MKYARQDSNLQPSVPKTDALSNCATGAKTLILSGFLTLCVEFRLAAAKIRDDTRTPQMCDSAEHHNKVYPQTGGRQAVKASP